MTMTASGSVVPMLWDGENVRRAVRLWQRLDRSWFRTRHRARMQDGDRQEQKELRIVRGLRLLAFWSLERRAAARAMTREEIKGLLRGVGFCGESDSKSACLLHVDHVGRHGFDLPSEQCDSVRDGFRCTSSKGHVGCHRSDGSGWSRAWSE